MKNAWWIDEEDVHEEKYILKNVQNLENNTASQQKIIAKRQLKDNAERF